MELWNYIQILEQKKQGWLFKKDNVEERLNALAKILEFGYPSSIYNLIPFLKDDNIIIQQTTCDVIIELFRKIKTKKGFYDTLKHCNISKSDIDYYCQNFSNEECLTLYAIATLNGSGHVREKALKYLAGTNNEKAIPFIVYRLADWVPIVRQTALKCISNFKKTDFINALVENLSIFEWLQKVERTDLSPVYADIMNFVVVDNRKFVLDNFRSFSDRTRILIAKQITNSKSVQLTELTMLIGDKNFLVRNCVLSHFEKLTQNENKKLLADKSARVRLQVLYKLKNKEDFTKIVFPFLSDNSASLREFARYSLRAITNDFATVYNNNLKARKNVIGALKGLAEINARAFSESVIPYLSHPKQSIRKAAFFAIQKLDDQEAYKFAFKNLSSEFAGIRNLVIDYFSVSTPAEVLEKARELYKNGNFELKKSMLKLFSRVGKWTTISDIMIGTVDDNENIRQLSSGYLQIWRNKAAGYFTKPRQGELERANDIFRFAYRVHEEKRYFSQNPLTGIDFYLR